MAEIDVPGVSFSSEKDLHHMIQDKMKGIEDMKFLPADMIEKLCTAEIVERVLQNSGLQESERTASENFIIARPVKRQFLLLAYCENVEWMPKLAGSENQFDDSHLPVYEEEGCLFVDRANHKPYPDTKSSCTMRRTDKLLFLSCQWIFLAPIFTTDQFHQELDVKVPLPFIEKDPPLSRGSFGSVCKALLHKTHHKGIMEGHNDHLEVALKQMTVLEHHWFVREMEILRIVQQIVLRNQQLHLVTPISSCSTHGPGESKGFLLFPWANGGNLKVFWKRDENKDGVVSKINLDQPPDRMVWTFQQMAGLCKALVELHSHPFPSGGKDANCRHGDLKPENILAFREGGTDVLRIADLGLAKFHLKSTSDRKRAKEYTETVTGTTQYMPPEFHVNGQISRRHDVWSLGCIFLEFIIWTAWGLEGLDKFNWRDNEEFWQNRRDPEDVVHDNIKHWIESMRNALMPNTALRDILELITSKMLRRLDKRGSSEDVSRALEEILGRCEKIGSYCLSEEQKSSIGRHILPKGQRSSPTNRGQEVLRIMRDVWKPHSDNHLARNLSRTLENARGVSNESGWKRKGRSSDECPSLCDKCSQLQFWQPDLKFEVSSSSLATSSGCQLCRLIQESLQGHNIPGHVDKVTIQRNGPTFEVQGSSRPILSFYTDPGYVVFDDELSQVGTPDLPVPGSMEQFQLFQEWLQTCSNAHDHARPLSLSAGNSNNLPTRVVDVGDGSNLPIHLTMSGDMKSAAYFALSHRWGDDSTHHVGRTLIANHDDRYNSISWHELPLNFKDAIEVTRGLGVRYLWIDSLCIVQDDNDDWARESVRMEEVYSNAQCVLAASSANSSEEGFLQRTSPSLPFITLQSPEGDISYISKNIDNFRGDVDEAVLNTRGWTLQERALARRTIHFTKNQVYFECSKGVQCESLIRWTNEKASLLGDSSFPASVEARYKGGRVMLVQALYNQYSKRTFWDSQDRPIAISGLEKRLTTAFNTRGGYGVFETFLERSLLWKKVDTTGSLRLIKFPKDRNVPSWSWMAYDGVISYVEADFNKVAWTKEYSSPFDSGSGAAGKWYWEADKTNRPSVLALEKVRELKSLPTNEAARTISFDTSASDGKGLKEFRCLVLGKVKLDNVIGPHILKCFVLIIKPSTDNQTVFTRGGAGILKEDQIIWDHYEAGILI
ncbi:serine/threonine protein kinase [Fusarium oxysporum f. sp. raphani 54005]|uniref:Serine/threonine protein kinase n=1 Tax=Fusarium oxysporum f. sp. raphani 54005 TaxID=1089458 RepID=X0BY60_FUSOX|nr:serine/threonine protein kinase [Fusarium oxysporum f. sp. raphani 54005]